MVYLRLCYASPSSPAASFFVKSASAAQQMIPRMTLQTCVKHVVATLLSNLAIEHASHVHNCTRITALAPCHHACGTLPQHQA